MLIGQNRMLIGRAGAFLRRADASLRFLVNLLHLVASVFNLLAVTACLLAHLIHLCLNGGGRALDVLLGGAPAGEQRARQDASRSKKSVHSMVTS
jgi:hypothetical protein